LTRRPPERAMLFRDLIEMPTGTRLIDRRPVGKKVVPIPVTLHVLTVNGGRIALLRSDNWQYEDLHLPESGWHNDTVTARLTPEAPPC
jgi:hypothetical protein